MSDLKPKDKCRIKNTNSDLDGLIAYITERHGDKWRARLPSKPNLPPLTFAAEELELIK